MAFTQKDEQDLLDKFPSNEEREKLEAKYERSFERYATYMGNGTYQWKGIYATDTRQLFLLGILASEGIYTSKD